MIIKIEKGNLSLYKYYMSLFDFFLKLIINFIDRENVIAPKTEKKARIKKEIRFEIANEIGSAIDIGKEIETKQTIRKGIEIEIMIEEQLKHLNRKPYYQKLSIMIQG